MARRDAEAELNLPPGFRFHPTDEELVVHYLCRKIAGNRLPVPIIAEVDLYKFDPWDLPEKALFGQREWYFFTPRERKYPNGSRPNRAAGRGYWKATGADKTVAHKGSNRPAGIKKALVFYSGKAPRGIKTDWIMHEYRLAVDNRPPNKKGNQRLDEWVLCRLYNKKNTWEKMQKQPKIEKPAQEETSFGEALDSFGESESLQTLDSDIDNVVDNTFPAYDSMAHLSVYPPINQQAVRANSMAGYNNYNYNSNNNRVGEMRIKEDNDWFTDLNLDDLQSSYMNLGPGVGPAAQVEMPGHEYYLSALNSSQLKVNQMNMTPF